MPQQVNTAEEIHLCPHCDYQTIRKGDLTKHIRVHSHNRPFSCTKCQWSFKQSSHLKMHMIRKHSESDTPFKCPHCKQAFSSYTLLLRHKKSHHGNIRRPSPGSHHASFGNFKSFSTEKQPISCSSSLEDVPLFHLDSMSSHDEIYKSLNRSAPSTVQSVERQQLAQANDSVHNSFHPDPFVSRQQYFDNIVTSSPPPPSPKKMEKQTQNPSEYNFVFFVPSSKATQYLQQQASFDPSLPMDTELWEMLVGGELLNSNWITLLNDVEFDGTVSPQCGSLSFTPEEHSGMLLP